MVVVPQKSPGWSLGQCVLELQVRPCWGVFWCVSFIRVWFRQCACPDKKELMIKRKPEQGCNADSVRFALHGLIFFSSLVSATLEQNILPGTCSSMCRKQGIPSDCWQQCQRRAASCVLSLALTACSCTKIVLQVTAAEVSLLFQGTKTSNTFAKSSSGQQEEQPQPSPGTKRFRADAASICAPERR